MTDIVRLYSKKPVAAEQRLANLLSEVMYEVYRFDERRIGLWTYP